MTKLPRLYLLLLALTGGCAKEDAGSSLLPDLSFWSVCRSQPNHADLVTALYNHGFDVLDASSFATQMHQPYPYPLKIDALNKKGELISIISFDVSRYPENKSVPKFEMSITLFSSPPTKHDPIFESELQQLVQSSTGCTAERIERHENTPTGKELYLDMVRQTRGWFEQASSAHAQSQSLRVH